MKHKALLSALGALLIATGAPAAPPEQETEHVVVAGETLNGIANRAQVDRDAIIEANGLKPPYPIRVGQKLAIPRGTAAPAASAPPAATSSSGTTTYVVQPGDTLGGIAIREDVPRVLIAEANGLAPPYVVRVGQKLVIPRTQRHTVAKGDTGFGIAYRYAVDWKAIAVANGLEADAPLKVGQTLLIPAVLDVADPPVKTTAPVSTAASRFAWPLTGEIRRGFKARGASDYHDGLDIVAPIGATVRASGAGKVIFAGKEAQQFGYLVVIDHGGGWHSAYGSLSRVTVKEGHSVARGERVGLVGDTSVTGRSELHFELRKDGTQIDPLPELPPRP